VIKAKRNADLAQIAKDLAAVNQCDTVRVTMSEVVAQRNTVLGAARDDLKQALDEEARQKGIMDAASNALESFTSTANSEKPPFDMPPATDKDATERNYRSLRSDLAAKTGAYTAQVAVAAGEQSVFDARLGEWKVAVAKTRDVYKTCRDTTVPVFEVTVAGAKPREKAKERSLTPSGGRSEGLQDS